ncbi:RlpA-like protein [Methylacidimicrobium cyclopophantes]|uniref:Probable endolytic peptidoglycan transglycosylase RlpA n=1 Tax=Methylacidimicrobium cyclopophantes TaxID=1041766 RepID=A0A5E6MAE6_9BACT|nr:septal ring lytic transglycosylase RlpA family protein [Methylacidimicrobium cyclopophantes]VVM05939.1 RlpA-like protein [Methylacidimicrobium cyclopophantes]
MFAKLTERAVGFRSAIGCYRIFSLALLFGSLGSIAEAKARQEPATTPFRARGTASWYDESRFTSTGERYRPSEMTAAHPSLPFGTLVSVCNLRNGKSVIVRINDRGPYKGGRIIDLSRIAAIRLGFFSDGLAPVELRVVPASRKLFASSRTPPKADERRGPVPF